MGLIMGLPCLGFELLYPRSYSCSLTIFSSIYFSASFVMLHHLQGIGRVKLTLHLVWFGLVWFGDAMDTEGLAICLNRIVFMSFRMLSCFAK